MAPALHLYVPMGSVNLSVGEQRMNAQQKYLSTIVATLLTIGCVDGPVVVQSAGYGQPQQTGKSDGSAGFYPRPTAIHLSDPSLGPVVPGAIKSDIPNAVAYTRYALGVAQRGVTGALPAQTAEDVAYGWAQAAEQSRIHPRFALRYASAVASSDEQHALLDELVEDAEHPIPNPKLTKVQARLADVRAGVRQCADDGFSPEDCCVAVGYFAMLSRSENWSEWGFQDLSPDFYTEWADTVVTNEQQ